MPPRLGRLPPPRAAILMVAGSVALHVAWAGWFGLSPQEAYTWASSRALALSSFDHPPLAAWTIRLCTELLGTSARTVRLAAALHATVQLAFLHLTARRLFGSRAALLALGLALLTPLGALGQVIVTPDAPLLSGWAAAFYFTVRAVDEERGRWLLLAGLAAGLAALGKYTALLLPPQILAALLLDPRGRRLLATPWPWLGLLAFAAALWPVLAWNAERHWVSLLFQSVERVRSFELRPALVGRFLGLQALGLSPLLMLGLVAAVVSAARRWREPAWRMAALFSAPLLLLLALISPFHWVKLNWSAPAWIAALGALSALLLEGWSRRWVRGFTWAAGGLAGAASLYLHLVPLVPALPFPARDDVTTGWDRLAARVEVERRRLGGDPLVLGCTYKPAAELMFLLPGRPWTQSAGVFGQPGLQFDEWLDPAAVRGREAILVVDPREPDRCGARVSLCRPLERLADEPIRRGSEPITAFQLWRCAIPDDAIVPLPAWRKVAAPKGAARKE